MNKEDYSKSLNHPLWEAKRNEIFSKYGKKCSKCGSEINLEIHHKTYSPDKMSWEYPVENFVVLCEKHHKNHHGFEYTINKCKECGREISVKFEYCLDCHRKLIAEKEIEKKHLENRIAYLENILESENNNKNKSSQNEIQKLKAEKNQLINKKSDIEINLSELKRLDDKFKDEIRADIKSIESKIILLEKEKNNKDQASQNKKNQLEREIAILKKETDNLKKTLDESKKIEEFKETITADNQRIESKINLLIKGLGVFAAIILIIVFVSWNTESPTKQDQTPEANETIVNKNEDLPLTNNATNNSREHEKNNTSSLDEALKLSPKKNPIPKSNKQEENNNVSSPSLTPPSSYKTISVDDLDSNIGNKIQISERILQVKYATNGNVYLNIGGMFPRNKLSLVIFKNDLNKFSDLQNYENKIVKIKGKLSTYKGKPQIIINNTWQLQNI